MRDRLPLTDTPSYTYLEARPYANSYATQSQIVASTDNHRRKAVPRSNTVISTLGLAKRSRELAECLGEVGAVFVHLLERAKQSPLSFSGQFEVDQSPILFGVVSA
jgi:hypothetical protein